MKSCDESILERRNDKDKNVYTRIKQRNSNERE